MTSRERIPVRPFDRADLGGAGEFARRSRMQDPMVEPFGERLASIASGPRAELQLWRVAEGPDGLLCGIAFAATREAGARRVLEVYAAVAPARRRSGLGRSLCGAMLDASTRGGCVLHARAREASGGARFLEALGFTAVDAQLELLWPGGRSASSPDLDQLDSPRATMRFEIQRVRRDGSPDLSALTDLANDAWAFAPGGFLTDSDDIAHLLEEEGRVLLVATTGGRPVGYLSAVSRDRSLHIEELAVVPRDRRRGVARSLLVTALRGASAATVSVLETNRPARDLYRSLGFVPAVRRLIFESGAGRARG